MMTDSHAIRFVPLDKPRMESLADELIVCLQGWPYATWQKSNFLLDLPNKWEYSFALYQGELLCGFCIASGKLPGYYYIHLIFLRDECRGGGVGRRMLDWVRHFCREHGLIGIRLRCPVSNEGAYRFYRDYGFQLLESVHDEISGEEADYVLEYGVEQK